MTPYYDDGLVTLYHGDMREVAPTLADGPVVVTDPPYGETNHAWDVWPSGWPAAVLGRSMWCFGSMRMFLEHSGDFLAARWRLSQDIIWEKDDSSGFETDRFRRVHEHALHWYRGLWSEVHHATPRERTW